VWARPLLQSEREETIEKYREFHRLLDIIVEYLVSRFGSAILFDIHSFRYQRELPVHWREDNLPEINVGTRYINRDYFATQVEAFLQMNSGITLEGKRLRIAENELFPGGYLTRKYTATHSRSVCVLAVEYKKIYMDEWSGILFPERLDLLKRSLLLTKDQMPRIKG
jgi:N-formylglutamate amidohydrolase